MKRSHPDGYEPLPPPPAFASNFWRAVGYVGAAHEQMERFGIDTLDLDAHACEAALRLRRQANEIADALLCDPRYEDEGRTP